MNEKSQQICPKQRKLPDMFYNNRKSNKEKGLPQNTNISAEIKTNHSCEIPVSLNFFKKYTEYEDVINRLLWESVEGNENRFNEVKDNETIRKNTLMEYYKAFYLEPDVRECYPVKLKAMPKHFKNKILQTNAKKDQLKHEHSIKSKSSNKSNIKYSDDVASDDSILTEEKDTLCTGSPRNKSKSDVKHLHLDNNSEGENTQPLKPQKDEAIRIKKTVIATETIHMKDLQRFEHCCPVTYKQFKDYTNIRSLVAEKFLNEPKETWPYYMKKTYLLFYLKPEVRLKSPLKDIKIKKSCPENIRKTFYIIPKKYNKIYKNEDIKKTCAPGETIRNYDSTEAIPNVDDINLNIVTNKTSSDNTSKSTGNGIVEILEHRILPPIVFTDNNSDRLESVAHVKPIQHEPNSMNNALREQNNEEVVPAICSQNGQNENHLSIHNATELEFPIENNCVFCHFPLNDFIKYTNVLQILVKGLDDLSNLDTKVRVFYINFIMDRLSEEEMSNISLSLAKVQILKKYQEICSYCANLYQLNSSQLNQQNYDELENARNVATIIEKETVDNAIDRAMNDNWPPLGTVEINTNEMQFKCTPSRLQQNSSVSNTSMKQCDKEIELDTTRDVNGVIRSRQENCIVGKNPIASMHVLAGKVSEELDKLFNSDNCNTMVQDDNTDDVETQLNETSPSLLEDDYAEKFVKYLKIRLKASLKILWKCINYLPVNYETFIQWSKYEVSLQNIVKKVAANNMKVEQIILNDANLCDLLMKKYYIRYFTNKEVRNKYPLILKSCPVSIQKKMLQYESNIKEMELGEEQGPEKEQQEGPLILKDHLLQEEQKAQTKVTTTRKFYSGIFSDEFLLKIISFKYEDRMTQQTLLQIIKNHYPNITKGSKNETKYTNDSVQKPTEEHIHVQRKTTKVIANAEETLDNSLRKFNELMSNTLDVQNINKAHTLTYVLRTRHGLKHDIICLILGMTFQEFTELVHIYEPDNNINLNQSQMKHLYNYIIGDSSNNNNAKIWPIKLYIELYDILKYIKTKNSDLSVHNDDQYLLKYISPKFLHWSDLIKSTNFLSCVDNYIVKRNVVKRDLEDNVALMEACEDYYVRCWKYDEWLGQVPIIDEQSSKTVNVDILTSNEQQHPASQTVLSSSMQEEFTQDVNLDLEGPFDHTKANYTHNKNVHGADTCERERKKQETVMNEHADNFIQILNTQEQIQNLPDEISPQGDPLIYNDNKSWNGDSIKDNNHIHGDNIATPKRRSFTPDYIVDDNICTKFKQENEPMLRDMYFYIDENEDNVIHCSPINPEIIELDDDNFDLNAVQYSPTIPIGGAAMDVTNENMNNVTDMETSSPGTCTTLEHNYTKNLEHTCTQRNVSIIIESDKCIQIMEPLPLYPNERNVNKETDRLFKTAFENSLAQKETVAQGKPLDKTSSVNVTNTETIQKNTMSGNTESRQFRTFKKLPRPIPLVKTNSMVPQLNHDFRSLPVQTIVKTNQQSSEGLLQQAPSLTASGDVNGNNCDTMAGSIRKVMGSSISQELERDCTFFNNSTLNRMVNATPCPTSQDIPQKAFDAISANSLNQCSRKTEKITRLLPSDPSSTSPSPSPSTSKSKSPSSSPPCKKVKNNEKNITQFIGKPILHRALLQFDYFQELTPQQIVRHALSTTEVDKTYYQAIITFGGLKMHISNSNNTNNNFLSDIFPFWSSYLQNNILNVLGNLKEYHYSIYKSSRHYSANEGDSDLRVRILNCLFKTAPPFSYNISLSYNINDPDSGHSFKLNYGNRLRYSNHVEAIQARILKRMLDFTKRKKGKR